ncbi:Hypothetical predicted protein [Olea europaea subsp. europaea]|uniref:Uncharacterized protein n=1 Tax=Olea europaea subsp. europaea TaxID=158383 RepID=A0A8S0UDI1_OLEEU|nr:Hypothetical predicted protein [Olea europaea subsp. europaea]
MSPKKERITPSRTKEHIGKETSSPNAPVIQEPLPTAPMVCHQESDSRSRHRLATRLTREMAAVTASMRAISRRMPSQLARSSQNEKVVLLEIGVNVDTVINYDTGRITQEDVVFVEGSRANEKQDRLMSLIGLVLQETKRASPPFHPLKPGALLFPLTDHISSIPFRRKISMDNLNQEPQMSSLLDTCILCLEIGEKDELH